MTWVSSSPLSTKKFAKIFAQEILRYKPKNRAFIVGLQGNLGSGKTTFIQGFAKGLGVRQKITSPTFLLIKRYPLRKKQYQNFFHIDAYRIKNYGDLVALGIKENIANPKNIIIIEWAEKVKKILPSKIIWLKFEHGQNINERIVKVKII
jgi:tRNA threonylcarbamoyladenosine biosynthesis protein TsaE